METKKEHSPVLDWTDNSHAVVRGCERVQRASRTRRDAENRRLEARQEVLAPTVELPRDQDGLFATR